MRVRKNPNYYWEPEEEELLKNLIGKYSFKEMAKFFPKRTAMGLNRKCCKMRLFSPIKYHYKKHSHDKHCWDIPTPLNSYLAGFFMADGCLLNGAKKDSKEIRPVPTFRMEVATKDKIILTIFKNFTKFTGTIVDYSRKNYKKETLKYVSKLFICAIDDWIEPLKNNFGIVPLKTYRCSPPNLNNIFLKLCFVIGYIDGDGYITKKRKERHFKIGMVSSNYKILEFIKNTLDINFNLIDVRSDNCFPNIRDCKPYNYYTLDTCGIRGLIIFDYLKQFPVPMLDRKWNNPVTIELLNFYKQKYPHLFLRSPVLDGLFSEDDYKKIKEEYSSLASLNQLSAHSAQ